jgi:isoaspartyl peptidase/L-asparaginase-like protein (Ntn-hydrolase superfamily)
MVTTRSVALAGRRARGPDTLAGVLRAFTIGAVALAVALAGCTSTSGTSSKFTGAKGDVADVVANLQQAGQRKDANKICTQILSRTLVQALSDAGTSCEQEMKKAIDDADDFDLTVQNVTINGNQATAQVRRGKDGPTATFKFVRESGGWRATSFGG